MVYKLRTELEQGLALLAEAEQALKSDRIDAGTLSRLELLSSHDEAMFILRRQSAYREKFIAALAGLEEYKAMHPLQTEPADALRIITPSSYNSLNWEQKAPSKGGIKLLYTFDKHQERLAKAGMRGPMPSEVFSLLADNLEGKLSGALKAAADDMMSSYGEWFAIAEKRQKDDLIVYVNPRGLVWNGKGYAEDNFAYDSEMKFDIAGIPSEKWVDLKRFKDDFVRWFYSMSFDKLPEEMRDGMRRAQVYLPSDGTAWPVGRSDFNYRFGIDGNYDLRASRGVSASPQGEPS